MKYAAVIGFALAVAALPAGAAESPTPGASPEPPALHELAHLDDPQCPSLLVHANAAIAAVLHDDAQIRLAVLRLRGYDAGDPDSAKRRSILNDLERVAGDVSAHADPAEAEIKRLRDAEVPLDSAAVEAPPAAAAALTLISTTAVGADAAGALRAFVDALARAVDAQSRIAADLRAFVANLENRELRDEPGTETESTVGAPVATSVRAAEPEPAPVSAGRPALRLAGPSPREQAIAAAADFELRSADVKRIEATAAQTSEDAVSGCSQLPHQ